MARDNLLAHENETFVFVRQGNSLKRSVILDKKAKILETSISLQEDFLYSFYNESLKYPGGTKAFHAKLRLNLLTMFFRPWRIPGTCPSCSPPVMATFSCL